MPTDPTTVIDPWQDARPAHKRTLSHRLSYDHASGVIMLPEGADWMDGEDEEEDSDVADYGTEHGLDQSIASLLSNDSVSGAGQSGAGGASGNGSGGGGQGVGLGPVGQRVSRYGTYFHHPERRTRLLSAPSVPGAFPTPRQ